MMRKSPFLLTGTSPASATKAIIATQRGLARYSFFQIDAFLQGATGGTLDLYLQRQIASGIWLDWAHFTQLGAGGAAVAYTMSTVGSGTIVTVGQMNDDLSVGSFVLPANTFVGGHPGDQVRLVGNAGAGTSGGAIQSVYISCFQEYT